MANISTASREEEASSERSLLEVSASDSTGDCRLPSAGLIDETEYRFPIAVGKGVLPGGAPTEPARQPSAEVERLRRRAACGKLAEFSLFRIGRGDLCARVSRIEAPHARAAADGGVLPLRQPG